MQIRYLNHEGGGFAVRLEIAEGTTVGEFFNQQMPNESARNYEITIRRRGERLEHLTAGEPLQENDLVLIRPNKAGGGTR